MAVVAPWSWSWPPAAAAAMSSTAPGPASWKPGTNDTRTSASGCQVWFNASPHAQWLTQAHQSSEQKYCYISVWDLWYLLCTKLHCFCFSFSTNWTFKLFVYLFFFNPAPTDAQRSVVFRSQRVLEPLTMAEVVLYSQISSKQNYSSSWSTQTLCMFD